jgi:hypothetical protein
MLPPLGQTDPSQLAAGPAIVLEGTITQTRRDAEVPYGFFLIVASDPVPTIYPLVIEMKHFALLRRLAVSGALARVSGTETRLNGQSYLAVGTVEELKP